MQHSVKRVTLETSHFQRHIERVIRLSVDYTVYKSSGQQLMQEYKLMVKQKIEWMMKMRIMMVVMMMKTVCPMAGSTMLLMQLLMRTVIISLELTADVESSTGVQKHRMKITHSVQCNIYRNQH